MDRTMYGKVDPGARTPYRCMLKEKGISPGCKSFILFLAVTKTLITYSRFPFDAKFIEFIETRLRFDFSSLSAN